MLGALGCIVPEVFGPQPETGNWITIPAKIFSDDGLNYLNNPSIVHAQSAVITLLVQVIVMSQVEAFRVNGGVYENLGLDKNYPGEAFDPLGLADDPEAFAELKVKEIKNGRLAMVGMLGFFAQAFVTGEGPIANLQKHLEDPGSYNAFALYATKFTPVA